MTRPCRFDVHCLRRRQACRSRHGARYSFRWFLASVYRRGRTAPIRKWRIHADAGTLDGLKVLDRAVSGVRDDTFGTELAAEEGAPELVEEGLILHDVARCDQAVQDNAGFAAINEVVVVVAQDLAAVR